MRSLVHTPLALLSIFVSVDTLHVWHENFQYSDKKSDSDIAVSEIIEWIGDFEMHWRM